MSDIVLASGARLRMADLVELLKTWADHFDARDHAVQLSDQCTDLVTSLKFYQADMIKKAGFL